jgi:hypothetical protein
MVRSSGKQDDWRTDTSGVKYYQIVGLQVDGTNTSTKKTLGLIKAINVDTFVANDPTTHPEIQTDGDGTVPWVSAIRAGNGMNYSDPI